MERNTSETILRTAAIALLLAAPGCGADDACPFGGACVHGAESRCMRACFSSTDCQSGFSCDLVSGGAREVCDP